MTKSEKLTLEAWNIWLIQNQLSTVNSDVNLRLSVLGQAFTGGWGAAIHSVMTQLSGFVLQTKEIEKTYKKILKIFKKDKILNIIDTG